MEENIYTPPKSDLIDETNETVETVLASRWQRLWASLLDSLIMLLLMLPIMFFTGIFERLSQGIQPSFAYNLLMATIGLTIFCLINGRFLLDNGQTVGKKVLGIKIVGINGEQATLNHFLKRYAVYFLPGQVPVVGQFFSLVNVLFIFGKEKRCIHDLAGPTKVVKA